MLGKDLIDRPQMWQLVLEAGASSLSVVAFSPYENHALIHETISLDASAPSALRALEDAVYENPMLLLDFRRVMVYYDAPRMAALPGMAASSAGVCLQRMFPPSDVRTEVLVDNIPGMDACVAFEIPSDILGFLRRTFHNASIGHPLVPVASYFGMKHSARPSGKTLVNITGNRLDVVTLGRGYAWMDAGTVEALSEASEFVRIVERREGIHISSPEEIAYHNGWIDLDGLRKSARAYGNSPYGQHLQNVADGKYIY